MRADLVISWVYGVQEHPVEEMEDLSMDIPYTQSLGILKKVDSDRNVVMRQITDSRTDVTEA